MSDKLDQPLDSLVAARRRNNPHSKKRGVGGVEKFSSGKPKSAQIPALASAKGGSKISISNLPLDVTDSQIKEYLQIHYKDVKKVILNYDGQGRSQGSAVAIFGRQETAAKAQEEVNGLVISNRPLIVELVGVPIVPEKKLSERITKQPKPQPKSAAARPKTAGAKKAKTTGRQKRDAKRRPKKTAEDLDADMDGYWAPTVGDQQQQTQQQAPPANGDVTMAE